MTFFTLIFSDEEGYGWVDSVGWDDLDKDDNEIFKEMLQFLNRHKLLSVKAIIWTIRPDIKMTNTLNKLAQFIDAFSKRDIWNNVIIIGMYICINNNKNTSECKQTADVIKTNVFKCVPKCFAELKHSGCLSHFY